MNNNNNFSKWLYASLFLVLGSFGALGANEPSTDFFRSGKVFVELSGGASTPTSPVLSAYESDYNILLASAIMATSSTSDETRKTFGLYQLSQVGGGSSSARNGRVGVEFAASDWFGMGASLESTSITVKDAYPYSGLFFLSLLTNTTTSTTTTTSKTSLSALDLLIFQKGDVKMEPLNTLNFDMGFHFPGTESLDPYLRVTIGLGSVSGGTITKVGGSLGARYKLGENFYMGLEGYGNAMVLTFGVSEGGGSTTVQEAGGRLSMGFAF